MQGHVIAIGSDHAGFEVKERIKTLLAELGYEVDDMGTSSTESVDYPDYAGAVARAVSAGRAAKGVLVCGTGIGMSIAANKVPGARAALAWSDETARLAREHNDANVLVVGARVTPEPTMRAVVESFFSTEFAGGRHEERVRKMMALDHTQEKDSHE